MLGRHDTSFLVYSKWMLFKFQPKYKTERKRNIYYYFFSYFLLNTTFQEKINAAAVRGKKCGTLVEISLHVGGPKSNSLVRGLYNMQKCER